MLSFNPTNSNLLNLEQTNSKLFTELLVKRKQRYKVALNNYLAEVNLNVTPAPTLQDLQEQLAVYKNIDATYPSTKITEIISKIENKIATGDYCKEGDSNWQIRQNIADRASTFVWPNAQEIALREQEELELLS